jgi:hypothetical protein
MTDHKAFTTSLAARGAKLLCMDPDIQGLTPEQLNALHLCKHEMLAAICRCYSVVDPPTADRLIKKYLADALGGGQAK